MGLWHKCPNCGEMCEHDTLTREDEDGHETMLLECELCGHDWFATISFKEPGEDNKPKKVERFKACPKCGCTEFDSPEGPLFSSDTRIEVPVECSKCGHTWFEYYELSEVVDEKDD